MKTYLKDFSMNRDALVGGGSELEELIDVRQERLKATAEYQEARAEAMEALCKLESLIPEQSKALGRLEDLFFVMECICFSAAYKDGMNDLMTAMTFNKLGFTKVEYFDLSRKGA